MLSFRGTAAAAGNVDLRDIPPFRLPVKFEAAVRSLETGWVGRDGGDDVELDREAAAGVGGAERFAGPVPVEVGWIVGSGTSGGDDASDPLHDRPAAIGRGCTGCDDSGGVTKASAPDICCTFENTPDSVLS